MTTTDNNKRHQVMRFVRNASLMMERFEKHQTTTFSAKDYMRAAIMLHHYYFTSATTDIVVSFGFHNGIVKDCLDSFMIEEKLQKHRAFFYPELELALHTIMYGDR